MNSLTPGTGSLSRSGGWESFKYGALTHTLALLDYFSFKKSAEKHFNESGVCASYFFLRLHASAYLSIGVNVIFQRRKFATN